MQAFQTRSSGLSYTRDKISLTHQFPAYIITSSTMKFACIALCVQAAGAFIAPAVTQSGESCALLRFVRER